MQTSVTSNQQNQSRCFDNAVSIFIKLIILKKNKQFILYKCLGSYVGTCLTLKLHNELVNSNLKCI